MKVLYIIDSLVGYGAEKSLVQIAIRLKDVEPVFIHLYAGEEMKSSLEARNISVYSLNLETRTTVRKARALVIPIIEKEDPDIIHSTLFRADMVARSLKRCFPNILLIGSFVSNSYCKSRYEQLSFISRLKLFSTQLRDRASISKVDYVISNSEAILETNIRALKFPRKKVKVIHRGRNIEKKRIPFESLIRTKKALELQDSEVVFLNVGRLHKGKGQLDLIHAFEGLVKEIPDIVLLIAGEGPFREELEDLIGILGLEGKVVLLGYREDVPYLLELADYFVFPSHYEGLPGSLIEAILAKKPCVVSNIPENMECFPEWGGLFFTPGDVRDLKIKMQQALLLDWGKKIAKSFDFARAKFGIDKVSMEYENFYKEVYMKKRGSF